MRWLKEPLLHFLLIGAALFLLYDRFGGSGADRPDRIVIDARKIERLATLWSRRWQRPPTPAELDGLIDAHIREEVLYREAKALGLEEDDTIVRRRLAQKMEFFIKDLANQSEPSDDELQAFLANHPERFREPARFTFRHVYLSRDRRGARTDTDSERLLEELRAQPQPANPSRLGDSFMLGNEFEDRSAREISRILGRQFADALADVPLQRWHGPVESGYGAHLIFMDARVPARVPPLDAIRARVRTELLAERQKQADEALYRELRARYEVVIERPQLQPLTRKGE
jgi:hypothetical protein